MSLELSAHEGAAVLASSSRAVCSDCGPQVGLAPPVKQSSNREPARGALLRLACSAGLGFPGLLFAFGLFGEVISQVADAGR